MTHGDPRWRELYAFEEGGMIRQGESTYAILNWLRTLFPVGRGTSEASLPRKILELDDRNESPSFTCNEDKGGG